MAKKVTRVNKSKTAQETPHKHLFPIVGIGASAGGLTALEEFFDGMPQEPTPDIAVIIVQHLSPDHKSLLVELIQRLTKMQVFEVKDGMVVKPNCTYIIPPNCDMALINGSLQLMEPSAPHGQRLPIDFFFKSLAMDLQERSIGVILSGTGSDGTLGLREIKSAGGMLMVQNPESAEYDGMPRSAIALGFVDYVLRPTEMPTQIIAYATQRYSITSALSMEKAENFENSLKKIFILLRAQTTHDFSQYKPSTVTRRIERRMAVQQVTTLAEYVKCLQTTPLEIEALFRDLLIGVTTFFRDPEAFLALEKEVIPTLFENRPAGSTLRIWSTGCSTGEEAYSIAILLQEQMERLKQTYPIQIFATDVDPVAIATARAGIYPSTIEVDITPERLSRYFSADSEGKTYRMHKSIRDMLVFSQQSVIKDPPFSRLDLISCRNLLIYMDGNLQQKLIPLFHYSLNPGGVLFLGTSETVGEFGHLFDVVDRTHKIFKRNPEYFGDKITPISNFMPPMVKAAAPGKKVAKPRGYPVKLPLRDITEKTLLEKVVPVAILVNSRGDILYIHGRTGDYLEPMSGEVRANNILLMARDGLRRDLTTLLHKAVSSKKRVSCADVRIKTKGDPLVIQLKIYPVPSEATLTADATTYLIIITETPALVKAPDSHTAIGESTSVDAYESIEILKDELRSKEEYIQITNEELETTIEELKSSNEELQSVNEEFQSTNEELETSKEELQSVNEELATVNSELQTKVADLSRINNDMNNLLAGTGIGTIFVDHMLRILRFTPAVTRILNLIPSDIGRPVGHIVSNLKNYDTLIDDLQRVLETLALKESEVQSLSGRWYMMRMQPYRTLDNVIEGAVITFVDIDEIKKAQEKLEEYKAKNSLATIMNDANAAIVVHNLSGKIVAWNRGAERLYGWTEAEALKMNIAKITPKEDISEELKHLKDLVDNSTLKPYATKRVCKNGDTLEVLLTVTGLLNEKQELYAITTTERKKG